MSTPNIEAEHPKRNWRQWRIPARIGGRVRTSTVAFGVCFVLTGLLYGQVNAEVDKINREAVQGPIAVDPSEVTPYTSPRSQPSSSVSSTTTPTPTATTDAEQPGGVVDGTGQQPTTTAPAATTTPFGLPLPPGIQSLIPTQPAPTSAR